MKLIKMKCDSCGATLDVNKNLEKITCNYCGAEILIDDEATKVKRVEDAKLKARKDNHEQSLKERNDLLEQEVKEKKIKEELNSVDNFKKGKFSKVLIAFSFISILFCCVSFNDGRILSGLLAILMVGLFVTSWLMGMNIIKEIKKGLHILLAIIGFILIFPYFSLYNKTNDYEKIIWEDIILNEYIPKTNLKKGEIFSNDEDWIWMSLGNASKSDYREYVKNCEKFGFTIDVDKDEESFSAYDENGNKIEVEYTDYDKELTIDFSKAMEMKKNVWPDSELSNLLPEPKSNKGHLEWEDEDSFLYYAADTSEEDFEDYVSALKKMGFKEDYNKDDDYYYADNKKGYHISVNLEGFNIMRIQIDSPDEDTEETKEEESSSDKVEESYTTEDVSSNKVDGMRTEFKEAMDSYEEFIDEYVAFMKKYSESNGTDLELITDYSKYMSKYAKMVEKFEEWEDDDLNSAEESYYLKVQSRVSKKLLEVAY